MTDVTEDDEFGLSQESQDFDENLELRDDVIESLKAFLASDQRGDDADELFRALGLD